MPISLQEPPPTPVMPPALAPARLARLLLLGPLLAAGSCGGSPEPAPLPPPGPTPAFDLVLEHRLADRDQEVERIQIGYLAGRHQLTRGWSFPPQSRDEDAPKSPSTWAHALESEVRLWLREPAPRTLRFEARSFHSEPPGALAVAVELNERPVGELVLDRKFRELTLELPAEAQRPGTNLLRFRFPEGQRKSQVDEASFDARLLTGCFRDIAVEIEDGDVEERLEDALALGEGSRVTDDGAAVEQVSGSLLRYHLRVPAGAAFQAQLRLRERSSSDLEAGLFEVVLLRDDGEEEILVRERVGDEPRSVHASLEHLAGQIVALDLRLSGADGEPSPFVGAWVRPGILAPDPAPEPVDATLEAKLAEARRTMAKAPVVMLLLDAFNPDFATAYGGRPGLTPAIDRLASEGVLFENAYSQASYTIASVASTLTSLYTWEHGAWQEATRLLDSKTTWPELFARAGYRTVGIVCSPNGSSVFGYERGFEEYHEVFRDRADGRVVLAEEVLPYVDRVLASEDERPLFLWLHVVEPHEPYDNSPAPWAGRFDPDYEGTLTGDAETLKKIRAHKLEPTPRDVEHLKAQYQEGLGYVDGFVAGLRERLEAKGLLSEGLFALYSDHGEAFLSHESRGPAAPIAHGSSTWNEMTRIPLVLRLPDGVGLRGVRTSGLVGNFDLVPTLADLVGVPPPPRIHGRSFAPLLLGGERPARPFLVSHSASQAGVKRFMPELAIWDGRYKYVFTSGDGDALYDVSRSRFEEQDLADTLPVRAGYLRHELRRILGFDLDRGGTADQGEQTELDPEVAEQLQALGYAGGAEN